MIETTVGRVLFNNSLPRPLQFVNDVMDKKRLSDFVGVCYELMGSKVTAEVVDEIKRLGFTYATISGMTIAVSDITVPASKQAVLEETTAKVEETERQYRRGLITEEEQYNKVVELWTRATDEITQAVKDLLDPLQGLGAMATSGATKGGIQPIRQLAGMRGLMADPSGRIIALPIRSNFREGLTALEYFLSTHGARKGLADTALRTADAGYLTRRLVDVAQDVIITADDCGTEAGIWFTQGQRSRSPARSSPSASSAASWPAPVIDPKTGEVLLEREQVVDEMASGVIKRASVDKVFVRSPLTCENRFGLCKLCYGTDLAPRRHGARWARRSASSRRSPSVSPARSSRCARSTPVVWPAPRTSPRVCPASRSCSRRARPRARPSSARSTAWWTSTGKATSASSR